MNIEVEGDRHDRLNELEADHGADWRRDFKPGTFGCHELLDRTAMVANIVESFILSHPACVQNPEWYRLADQAVTALNDLYQHIGAEQLDESHASPG